MSLFSKRSTATTLEALRDEWSTCQQCPFYVQRQHVVMGVGPVAAPVFVVGQSPAGEEDQTGIPFQGRGGIVTKQELAKIGIPFEHLFLTNVIVCRPFKWAENVRKAWADNCADRLEAELLIVKPKMIVALGNIAAQRFLPTGSKGELRGRHFTYRGLPGVTIIHPAILNRQMRPDARKTNRQQVDEDMRMVQRLYQKILTNG